MDPVNLPRTAGVLLHPTSLPGPHGIGDLGHAAYAWVDRLARARQSWWQILPLAPTGYGDSPYSSFSAFAGNPLLISPETLAADGLLSAADLPPASFPDDHVAFGPVIGYKARLLSLAWERFKGGAAAGLRDAFHHFGASQPWLDDFALFMAIKEKYGGGSWQDWPDEVRLRRPEVLDGARRDLADATGLHRFCQFLFARQWESLKRFANERGVRLIGDIPIFVAGDSSDVWAHPDQFLLDGQRRPVVVAGVPPDYFSATGQLWGNPQYDWEAMKRTGYAWWLARVQAGLAQVDLIRLDHFRGFQAAWHIPGGMPTAQVGHWVPGPGADLFETIRNRLGRVPFIAEDLGVITPEVDALREQFGLPGMRILQFAFGGAREDRFLPHNHVPNTVVYTGTHDNDTTRGWFGAITEHERDRLRRYTGRDGRDAAWDLIRLAWGSVAATAVTTLQDVLDLGTEARMNRPGLPGGNWGWRFRAEQLTDGVMGRLADLTTLYNRDPRPAR